MSETKIKAKGRILVVDDEEHVRRVLSLMLERQGYEVAAAGGGVEGLKLFDGEVFDLVILDLRMPDMDGIELLVAIKKQEPDQTVVMITAYASVETALSAMKQGAFDYIGKPFKEDEIVLVVQKALERAAMVADNRALRSEVAGAYDFTKIIGSSAAINEVFKVMRKVADTKATVLISGESGTGKELVARALHYNSRRKDRPLVAVNCAAIPHNLIEAELFGAAKGAYTGADKARKGLLEEADGSSLFLDEVGELPLEMQAKLLRALQEGEVRRLGENLTRPVDIRVLAATNKDLEAEVESGGFREDLFYRLNVISLELPPLRKRSEDIPLLARHFVKITAKKHDVGEKRLSPEVVESLQRSPLKGNVRELMNILEQAVVMSDGPVIGCHDLPSAYRHVIDGIQVMVPTSETDLKKVLKRVAEIAEEQVIRRVLLKNEGNRTQAAKELGVSRRTLITKIQELGLETVGTN